MLQRGTKLNHNKYHVEDVIGQGGFGYVYRARDQLTGELVAIKELIPGLGDQEMVQRFIREARATLRLSHPHIARTYGIFQDRDTYYLAMEYLSGGSLTDRLERGPLSVKETVRVANDLCEALMYAHNKGVVHCDIKPANVLFDAADDVRLADFGIAHVSDQMMTRQFATATGTAMGTVRYMAPEQLEGVRDDPRLDIYAVGALLYEMLTGRPYLDFETETTPAAQMRNIQRIQSDPPRSLQAVKPSVPSWLAQVVEQALHKVPEERFACAEALRQALRQASYPKNKTVNLHSPQIASNPEHKPQSAAPKNDPAPFAPSPAKPRPKKQSDDQLKTWFKSMPVWAWVLSSLAVIMLLIGSAAGLQRALQDNSPSSTERPSSTSPPTKASLGDTWTRPNDGMVMVYVPSGDFLMGSDDNDVEDALQLCNEYSSKCKQSWFEIEQPAHSVTLDGFWLDQTEVTNAQFASFLNAQGNQMQGSANWLDVESERCLIEHTEEEFKPKSNYAAHPAVEVSWYGAAAYCAWVGGRLPTEAEWEYAARGSEGAIFPWGDSSNNTPLNFCDVNCSKDWKESKHDDGYERTAPVGTYSKGASWVDAMDMAGNAWEWVADWYGDYPARDQKNPTGPEKGEYRVLRGGSWLNNLSGVRGANRYKNSPELTKGYVGFRCVKHTLH